MAAQMLAAAGANPEQTAANLGAGDSMALLEAKAAKMAEEEQRAQAPSGATPSLSRSLSNKPSIAGGGGAISFVRGNAEAAVGGGERRVVQEANPDEIDIGDAFEEEEELTEGQPKAKGLLLQQKLYYLCIPSSLIPFLQRFE